MAQRYGAGTTPLFDMLIQYGRGFVHISKLGIYKKLSKPRILNGTVPISTRASILDTIRKTGNIPLCFTCDNPNEQINIVQSICIHHSRGLEIASATMRATR